MHDFVTYRSCNHLPWWPYDLKFCLIEAKQVLCRKVEIIFKKQEKWSILQFLNAHTYSACLREISIFKKSCRCIIYIQKSACKCVAWSSFISWIQPAETARRKLPSCSLPSLPRVVTTPLISSGRYLPVLGLYINGTTRCVHSSYNLLTLIWWITV